MIRFAPFLLLLALSCSPATAVLADEINGDPDPPSPGFYPITNGASNDGLTLLSNGTVQVQMQQTVLFDRVVSGTCGTHEGESMTCVVLLKGTYSNFGVTGGKLKTVWTDNGSGSYTVYWPADANGLCAGILSRFNATAPWSAIWDGTTWTVTMGGAITESACPSRSGLGWGGVYTFAQ